MKKIAKLFQKTFWECVSTSQGALVKCIGSGAILELFTQNLPFLKYFKLTGTEIPFHLLFIPLFWCKLSVYCQKKLTIYFEKALDQICGRIKKLTNKKKKIDFLQLTNQQLF